MTIKFRFIWIDDDAKRAASWKGGLDGSLGKTPVETDLEVIEVTERLLDELNDRVGSWKENSPDLIMLDHNFSKVPRRLFDIHGSALAHLLRNQLPNIPIICLSGQKINSEDFNIEDLSEYTYLFEVDKINSETSLELLFSIARDFKKLCFPPKQPIRHLLIDILSPPQADRSALISILPEEFEGAFVHGSSPHRIARWILNVLMQRPGFLYDSLETATFLGLSESAFLSKVASSYFETARYKGPFATDTRPLWWASALTDELYADLPDQIALSPQEAGRKFPNILEEDFSRCRVTGSHTPPPDAVAYTDETKSDRKPVRYKFTVPLSEEASSLLGFSTRLMIRNDRRGN